jgi:autotransporter-associated beta strand protein
MMKTTHGHGWLPGTILAAFLACLPASADNLYWDFGASPDTNWFDVANWDTAADGTGGDPGAVPGAADIAVFNTSVLNTPQVAALRANVTLSGFIFNNTATTFIGTTGANRRIFVGADGITVNAGAGLVTFGTGTANWRVPFTLQASQTWLNNSANELAFNTQNTVTMDGNLLTIDGTGDINLAGVISSTTAGNGIVKNGAGVLVLSAANTFNGGVTLNDGWIRAGNNSALGTGTLTVNGGKLSSGTAVRSLANTYILGGDLVLGDATYNGALTLAGAGTLTGNRTLTVDTTTTISGAIDDGGNNYLLTKAGTGTLTLSGANSYGGGTQVDAGTLNLANLSAMPFSGTVSVGAGAALVLAVDDSNPLSYWTTAEIDALWANSLFGFDLDSGALVGIDTSPANVTYATSQSTRGLVKLGTNALVLTGNNTFGGGIDVRNGALQFGSGAALGSGTVTLRTSALTNTADATAGNALELAPGTATIGVQAGTTLTMTGGISGPGRLEKRGDGDLSLSGAVNTSSNVFLYGGAVTLGGAVSFGTWANNVDLVQVRNNSVLNLAGDIDFGARLRLGYEAGTTAVVNQTSGTVVYRGDYGILVGNTADGGAGIYNLIGGTLSNAPGAEITLGTSPRTTAIFNMSGGTLYTPTLEIGRNSGAAAGSTNYFTQSGGTATVATLVMGRNNADSPDMDMNLLVTNGTFAVTTGFTTLAPQSGQKATLYFGPGADVTLPAMPITRGAGAVVNLTLDGNRLTPAAASTSYMTNLTSAVLTDNGVTLDVPTGRNITIGQGLDDAPGDNGVLRKTGAGVLTLAGANTYSGGTVVSNGTLALATTAAQPGTGTIDVLAAGALGLRVGGAGFFTTTDVDNLWANTLAGVTMAAAARVGIDTTEGDLAYGAVQSTRGLVKLGANTLTLAGDNTCAGGTEIHNGVLQLGNGGTTGALGSGDILNNATLTVNRADSYMIPGILSGAGALVKNGAGTLTLTNAVTLGNPILVSAGTLVLSNAPVTGTANSADYVGRIAGDSGVLRIEGTTFLQRNQNNFIVGAAGSTGIVHMAGGVFTNSGLTGVGNGGVGAMIQTGGSILNAGEFDVAYNVAGGYGYYQMSGGAMTNNTWLQASRAGSQGLIYQDGGSIALVNAANGLIVGHSMAGTGTGVVYLSGGTMTTPSVFLSRGAGARGELTVDGTAALTISGALTMNYVAGTNVANLRGGVLTATQVTRRTAGGLSILNFDGGTLRAGAAGNLINIGANAPDFVHVYGGGATIDDGGFAVTISPDLLAPPGDGVTALGLGVGSVPGYIGAPYVVIDGGGGTGATAVALFDHVTGSVTGLLVTSPGFGYTGAPTVTLTGGGREDFAVPSVTTAANASGGLTKLGVGTLRLDGANTYAGGTVISNGTLAVGSDTALGTGDVTMVAGTVLSGAAPSTLANRIDMLGAARLDASAGATLVLTGTIDAGGLPLTKTGAGRVTLTGGNDFGGLATIANGPLELSGNGLLSGVTAVLVTNRGALALDNTAVNLGDRMPDAAPITLAEGGLAWTHGAAAGTAYTETLGALTFAAGTNGLSATRAAADGTSALTFASLARNGTAGAVVEANDLGLDDRNRIFFSAAPATANGILPWMLLKTGTSDTGADWHLAEYDGVAGLRAPVYVDDETSWGAVLNSRPSMSQTLTDNRYLNSLVLDDDIHILGPAADRQLYFTNSGSAAVIVQTGGFSSITNNGNAGNNLWFGGNQAIFHTIGDLFIRRGGDNNQSIRGTNGYVKTGPGTLTLLTAGQANNATPLGNMRGIFSIEAGTLELQHANAAGGTVLTLNGGRLAIRSNSDLAFKAQDAVPTNTPLVVNQNSTVLVARVTFAEGGRTHTFGNLWIAPGATLTSVRENFDGNSGVVLRFDELTLGGSAGVFVQNGTGTGDGQITVTNLTDGGGGFDFAVNGSSVIRSEFRVLGTMALGGNLTVGAGGAAVVHAADGFVSVAGNIAVQNGAIVSSIDFTRELGAGAGQVRFVGNNQAGIGARGTPATFALTQGGQTGLLAWATANFEIGTLTLNEDDAGARLTLLNGLDLNSGAGAVTRQISVYNNVALVAGAVTNTGTGTANLTKTDGGELWLEGGNSWNGTTRITGGLLRIPSLDTLSPGYLDLNPGNTIAVLETAGVLTNSLGNGVGQVRLRGTGTATQTSRPGFSAYGGDLVVDLGGDGTGTGAELVWDTTFFDPEGPTLGNAGGLYLNSANANGALFLMNPIDLSGIDFGVALPLRRFDVLGSVAVLSGDIRNSAGAYAAGLRKMGGGTLVLLGSNTYDGYTRIDNGTLVLGTNGTSGTLGTGHVTNLAAGVLAFNRSNGYVVPNLIAGDGTVAQIGSGTTTLTADNTYSGPTVVSNGILRINGIHSGAGLITVAGGTLGGTGSVAGALVVENFGRLAPGASAGIFETAASVTLQNGATFEVELNGLALGVDYDQLRMGAGTTLSLADPTLLVQLGFVPDLGDVFTIVQGFAVQAGTFDGLADASEFNVNTTTFRIDYGDDDITLTVVPEPAAMGALGLLAAALLLRRRPRD